MATLAVIHVNKDEICFALSMHQRLHRNNYGQFEVLLTHNLILSSKSYFETILYWTNQ